MLVYFCTAGEHLKGEVVAFGTGNKCVSLQGVTKDGRGLVDCHALAVARRAFRKYGCNALGRCYWYSINLEYII